MALVGWGFKWLWEQPESTRINKVRWRDSGFVAFLAPVVACFDPLVAGFENGSGLIWSDRLRNQRLILKL